MSTWSEILDDLDGHIHSEAKNCRHDGRDLCRVCCPHDDPIEYVPTVPSPETHVPVGEPFGWLEWAGAVSVVLAAYAVTVGIIFLLVRWFG